VSLGVMNINNKSQIPNNKQVQNSNDRNSKEEASFQDAKRATTGSLHSKNYKKGIMFRYLNLNICNFRFVI
jgi:hypothetical protein